jgi:hypothetical protein
MFILRVDVVAQRSLANNIKCAKSNCVENVIVALAGKFIKFSEQCFSMSIVDLNEIF